MPYHLFGAESRILKRVTEIGWLGVVHRGHLGRDYILICFSIQEARHFSPDSFAG
jgi:hypothetical protein